MKRRKSRPRRKECKDERKLRELATEFENEAVILIKGGEGGRAIATRACAERLRAALAEQEGL